MERFAWFYDEILAQIAHLKELVLSALRGIPFLGDLSDSRLEWVFFGMVFAVAAFVIFPLLKISVKVAVAAAAIAAVVAGLTSYSFWGVLPYSGLGVAIVLFSYKFQTG